MLIFAGDIAYDYITEKIQVVRREFAQVPVILCICRVPFHLWVSGWTLSASVWPWTLDPSSSALEHQSNISACLLHLFTGFVPAYEQRWRACSGILHTEPWGPQCPVTLRSPSAPRPSGITFLTVCWAPPGWLLLGGVCSQCPLPSKTTPPPFLQPLLKCHLPTEAKFRGVFLFKFQPPPIPSDFWFSPCLQSFTL